MLPRPIEGRVISSGDDAFIEYGGETYQVGKDKIAQLGADGRRQRHGVRRPREADGQDAGLVPAERRAVRRLAQRRGRHADHRQAGPLRSAEGHAGDGQAARRVRLRRPQAALRRRPRPGREDDLRPDLHRRRRRVRRQAPPDRRAHDDRRTSRARRAPSPSRSSSRTSTSRSRSPRPRRAARSRSSCRSSSRTSAPPSRKRPRSPSARISSDPGEGRLPSSGS